VLLVFALCAAGCLLAAASAPGQSTRGGQIPFDVDEAVFSANQGFAYIEVYFAIPRTALKHQKAMIDFEADFETAVGLYAGDSLLAERKRTNTDRVAALTDMKESQLLFNIFSFYIRPGSYKLRARVEDQAAQIGGWVEKTVSIAPFPESGVYLSDIQLSIGIEADTSQNPYVKNGYRIMPNPNRMYGAELPILYYYSEINNLSPMQGGLDSSYTVEAVVQDIQGNPVKSLPVKNKKRLGRSVLELGMVNVAAMASGPYKFQLTVRDNGTGVSFSRSKDFFVYRRADYVGVNRAATALNETMTDEFSAMELSELDELFKKCQYIATDRDKKLFKKLDLNGKRKFMTEFWRVRDSNALTAVNEFKQDYFELLQYVEQHFRCAFKPGWKTDQGRIMLTYGKPDEVERFPSNIDKRAYEIWHYYTVEGGTRVYFVDTQDLGEMRLVHSTIRTELQDETWERWLTR
ncbi:MAG TPA: GWxTD domain-containing protein, partial [bacterium]